MLEEISVILATLALGLSAGIFLYQRKIDKDIHKYVVRQEQIQASYLYSTLSVSAYELQKAIDEIESIKQSLQAANFDKKRENLKLKVAQLRLRAKTILEQLAIGRSYIDSHLEENIREAAGGIELISSEDVLRQEGWPAYARVVIAKMQVTLNNIDKRSCDISVKHLFDSSR